MSLKFLGDVFDIGDWVLVSDRPVVDRSIVLYWAIRPIFLFDTESTCSVWGFGWFNIAVMCRLACGLNCLFG